jgi:hypothetical protein
MEENVFALQMLLFYFNDIINTMFYKLFIRVTNSSEIFYKVMIKEYGLLSSL